MNWRSTIRLGVVFVALVAVWMLWRPSEERKPHSDMLFPWSSDKYAKIEIQPAGKPEIILEQRIGVPSKVSWYIAKPVSRPAWDPYVADMVGGLRALTSDDAIAPGKPGYDLALAGVDKPALVVHLTAAGARKTIKFGKQLTKDPAQRWFTIEGDPNLYFGGTGVYDALTRSVGEIRHRGVVFFERKRLAKIEIHSWYRRSGMDPQGRAIAEEGYDVSEFDGRSDAGEQKFWWCWVKDNDRKVEEKLDYSKIQRLISDLDGLMAEDFAEMGDPAKYGLAQPDTKIRLWLRDEEKPIGILIGKTEKAGDKVVTYVSVEGSSEVALVESQRIGSLAFRRNAFRSSNICDFALPDIKELEVAGAAGRIKIACAEEKKDGEPIVRCKLVEPEGLQVLDEGVARFVLWISRLSVKDFLGRQPDLKLFALDPPGTTVTVRLRGGDGDEEYRVFRFGRKESGDTYLMKPGTDEVFSAEESVYRTLDLLDLNFRSPIVFQVVPRTSIVEISADIQDEKDLEKRHYFWILKQSDGTWKFRDTVNQGEIDPKKVDDVLAMAGTIEAAGFLSRRPEARKEYGLEGNAFAGKFEVAYKDKDGVRRQCVLKISRPLAMGTRCGMIEGDPTIFRLKQILVDTLKAGVLKAPDEKPQ